MPFKSPDHGRSSGRRGGVLAREVNETPNLKTPPTLAARRKYVRDALKPLRQQMNRLVKGLLG